MEHENNTKRKRKKSGGGMEKYIERVVVTPPPPWEALQYCTVFWTCCGDSTDSDLALFLHVLACNVCGCQS